MKQVPLRNRASVFALRRLAFLLAIVPIIFGSGCGKPAALRNDAQGLALTEATLGERYRALEARRAKLAPGGTSELEAFNRDAAAYTADRATFRAQQQVSEKAEERAQTLLLQLRAAVSIADYARQAQIMQEALEKHRARKAFPQISTLARQQLGRVTRPMVEKRPVAPSGLAAPSTSAGGSLAALRALINSPLSSVPRDGSVPFIANFHVNPGLPPLDYANVTKAQLLAQQKLYTGRMVQALEHPERLYRGDDVEFNLLLKPYYADQTSPTKRLSESDYDRIVTLCREIATESTPAVASAPVAASATPPLNAGQTWTAFERLRKEWPKE